MVVGRFQVEVNGATVDCALEAANVGWYVRVLSADPTSAAGWRDEEGSGPESFWRPAERIRMAGVARCGPLQTFDLGLQGFSLSVKVTASTLVGKEPIASSEVTLTLPGAAGVAQSVTHRGRPAIVSGDLLAFDDGGRPGFDSARRLGPRADQVKRAPLPPSSPKVEGTAGGVRFSFSPARLVHWTEDEGIPKGRRRVESSLRLALDLGAAESETSAALSVAQKELDERTATLDAASAKVAATAREPARKAERASARAEQKAAQAALAAASRAVTAAKGAAAQVRTRASRAFDCRSVALVTTRAVRPANAAGGVTAACAMLAEGSSADQPLVWSIERYELPLALSFSVDGVRHFELIASDALARFDPR
jgi:hypothetical protein